MKKLSWFIFFLIFLSSCLDDPECFQLHNDVLGITFRVIGTGQGDSVMLRDLKMQDGVFIDFSSEGDELVPITSFEFSLNYFKELEILNFNGDDVTNTMSLAYTVKNQFISEDCGSSFVLSDLRLLSHDFDSARVISSTPSKNGGTNIEIYRCPETDTLTINFNQLYATSNAVTITNPRSTFISHQFESITTNEVEVYSGRAATVKLPVDLSENEMTYEFDMNGTNQTLSIKYDLVTEQRYRPCGIQTFVTNLTLGEHTFDSVSYGLNSDDEPLRTLQDPHIANFRIYDCPPTNLMQVAFRKDNVLEEVIIKGIIGPFGNLVNDPPDTTSTIIVPVDLTANESTFYIQYADDTFDTLTVQYTRTDLTLFNACGDPVITNVTSNLENVNVIPNRPTLQFPPVTHVEIILD